MRKPNQTNPAIAPKTGERTNKISSPMISINNII